MNTEDHFYQKTSPLLDGALQSSRVFFLVCFLTVLWTQNLSELYPNIPNLVKFTPKIQSFPQFFVQKSDIFLSPKNHYCKLLRLSIHPSFTVLWRIAALLLSSHPFPFPAGKLNSDLHAICMEIHRKGLRKFIPQKTKKFKWGKSSRRRRSREVVSPGCASNVPIFFEDDLCGCCWIWKLHFLRFGIVGGREIFAQFPRCWVFQCFKGL